MMFSQSKPPVNLAIVTISKEVGGALLKTKRSILEVFSAAPGCTIQHLVICPDASAIKNFHNINSLFAERQWLKSILVTDQGTGIYAAMNKGIACALARGATHISFINSGDQLLPDYCTLLKRAKVNRDQVHSGLVKIIDANQGNRQELYEGGLYYWNVPHPGTIYPSSIFFRYRYHEYLRISADWHLHFSLRNRIGFQRCRDLVVAAFYTDGISNSLEASSILMKDELRQFTHEISKWNFSCFHPVRFFRIAKIAIISLVS